MEGSPKMEEALSWVALRAKKISRRVTEKLL
jgi:hypothetical protein